MTASSSRWDLQSPPSASSRTNKGCLTNSLGHRHPEAVQTPPSGEWPPTKPGGLAGLVNPLRLQQHKPSSRSWGPPSFGEDMFLLRAPHHTSSSPRRRDGTKQASSSSSKPASAGLQHQGRANHLRSQKIAPGAMWRARFTRFHINSESTHLLYLQNYSSPIGRPRDLISRILPSHLAHLQIWA